MRGKFICLEGSDASGTTTQTRALSDLILARESKLVFTTKEPYQGEIHDLIRKIISGDEKYQKYKESLSWLYIADRDYHIRDFIEPTLDSGIDVITDRYIPSTLAYQSKSKLHLDELYNFQWKFPKPDLTFYLKVPGDICFERLNNRDTKKEIFEEKEFLEELVEKYDSTFEYLKIQDWNIKEVDGTNTVEKITEEIYQAYLSIY